MCEEWRIDVATACEGFHDGSRTGMRRSAPRRLLVWPGRRGVNLARLGQALPSRRSLHALLRERESTGLEQLGADANDLLVEARAGPLSHFRQRLLGSERRAVRAVRGHRLDHVGDSSVFYYGTNLGYWEQDAEEGGGEVPMTLNISVTPNADSTLPIGIRKRYHLSVQSSSYHEPTGD